MRVSVVLLLISYHSITEAAPRKWIRYRLEDWEDIFDSYFDNDQDYWEDELRPSYAGKACSRRRGYCIDWRMTVCPVGFKYKNAKNCGQWGICCLPPRKPVTTTHPEVTVAPHVSTTPGDFECGVSKFPGGAKWRIIGGRNAEHGEYPWQVSLMYDGEHSCGGTLLNNQWVLSAAHCFIEKSRTAFKVVTGEHHLKKAEDTENKYEVDKIIDHPEYHKHDTEHDISLVKLKHVIPLNDYVIPACLPEKDEEFEKMFCTVTGWGHTEENGFRSDILQEVTVPIVTKEECARRLEENGKVYGTNICAGLEEGGKDACQYDSGGPLNCRKHGENWKVVGIVSWGNGCGREEKPGVYTNVAAYADWVKVTMVEN